MTASAATPQLSATADALRQKIVQRTARVGVVGLGYVGLPLAVTIGSISGVRRQRNARSQTSPPP